MRSSSGFTIFRRLCVFAVLSVLATACASLPRVTPDMANVQPVRLEGSRGPVSAGDSKAVIDRLKARSPDTSIFDRHLAVEEALVDNPLTLGNKVTLLQDGPTTFKHMYAAIRAARHRIYVESYIFEQGEIGDRVAADLIERSQHGVDVYVIYDSVGSLSTPAEFFKTMTDAGIHVLQFNPVNPLEAKEGWDVNQRDHRKLLVVDGQVAFVGGINISSVYSSSPSSGNLLRSGASKQPKKSEGRGKDDMPWRDTQVKIEGPVAAAYESAFIAMWRKQSDMEISDPPKVDVLPRGDEVVRAIASGPDQPYSEMYATLISAINSAESSVHFTMAYFVPDPQFVEALTAAAARGVDVRIVLPGKTDSALVFYAARSYYAELIDAGIKIYERRDALLHAKTSVIDGVWSTIGSTNLDWRSFLHNYELNAVVLGPEFGNQMEAMFARDQADSELITPQQWHRRSVLERIKECGARVWAYWL